MSNLTVRIDPRQALTIANYRNPKSDTFGNLKQSMIIAGYDEAYANSISGQGVRWISEATQKDVAMIKRAEKNLQKYLEVEINLENKLNVDIAKLQVDVSKFILKTIARQKYSEDKDTTLPNVSVNITNYNTAQPSHAPVIHETDPSTIDPSTITE